MRRILAVGGVALVFALGLFGGSSTHWTNPAGPNVAAAVPAAPSPPADGTGTPGLPTLKDTLAKGLKARLPGEFAFVDKVVELVNNGTLPLSLVDSTFDWARKKPVHQFQYFRQGLIVRAKQMGVQM